MEEPKAPTLTKEAAKDIALMNVKESRLGAVAAPEQAARTKRLNQGMQTKEGQEKPFGLLEQELKIHQINHEEEIFRRIGVEGVEYTDDEQTAQEEMYTRVVGKGEIAKAILEGNPPLTVDQINNIVDEFKIELNTRPAYRDLTDSQKREVALGILQSESFKARLGQSYKENLDPDKEFDHDKLLTASEEYKEAKSLLQEWEDKLNEAASPHTDGLTKQEIQAKLSTFMKDHGRTLATLESQRQSLEQQLASRDLARFSAFEGTAQGQQHMQNLADSIANKTANNQDLTSEEKGFLQYQNVVQKLVYHNALLEERDAYDTKLKAFNERDNAKKNLDQKKRVFDKEKGKQLKSEKELEKKMTNLLADALNGHLDERTQKAWEVYQEQWRELEDRAVGDDEKKVRKEISTRYIETDETTRKKTIKRQNIGSDVKFIAYHPEDGIKRFVLRDLDLKDAAGVDIDWKNVDLSTLTPEQQSKLNTTYEKCKGDYEKTLFESFFTARLMRDTRFTFGFGKHQWEGTPGHLSLKAHEWQLLEKNFSGVIDKAIDGSKNAKTALKNLEKKGLMPTFKLKWLLYLLIALGVIGGAPMLMGKALG
ncbi:MAG: hypothetical protein M1450_04695 [Patescibacteria group bacterium]|nr:hypothetical protein [Patescibacteria group bacterium]